jgi:hypothetical protein
LADFYAGDSPGGLYASEPCDLAAQEQLLAAIDNKLSPNAASAAEGPPDGLTESEVTEALHSMPKDTRPGHDGLPYQFYKVFWPELKQQLVEVANEAYASASLPPSMLKGVISMVYKGKGQPVDSAASYRPLTLLCCDYKILAKVLVHRLTAAAASVVDPTQTAFLPGRWIGDNTLFHVEQAMYLQHSTHSACLMFLDFEKAYDRVDRGWLDRCMAHLGFGPTARAWVSLLLRGTCAQVMCNRWPTRVFPVSRGLAQGSPLSPLLYVLIAQPLAARLRQLQRMHVIRGVLMPDGTQGPMSHQHADDTVLQGQTVADVHLSIQQAVVPFCRASCQKLNLAKSKGLTLGSHPPLQGMDGLTGAPFLGPTEHVCHLGILLGRDMLAASAAMWQRRLHKVRQTAHLWSRYNLSHFGRVHVGKTVLEAQVCYHATVLPPPSDSLHKLVRVVEAYVRGGVALADGPFPISHPARAIAALPTAEGGVGHPDLPIQVQALQAKVARLALHPAPRSWKQLFLHGVREAAMPSCQVAPAVAALYAVDLHTSFQPGRYLSYLTALRAARPHRGLPVASQSHHGIMQEALLQNAQVLQESGQTLATTHLPVVGGFVLRNIQDLRTALQLHPQHPQLLQLCQSLPAPWQQAVHVLHPPAASYYASPSMPEFVWDNSDATAPAAKCYRLAADCTFVECNIAAVPPTPTDPLEPCCVLPPDAPGGPRLFCGRYSQLPYDPAVWYCGVSSFLSLTVCEARKRMLRCRLLTTQWAPLYRPGAGMRPILWQQSLQHGLQLQDRFGGGIAALEQHWHHQCTSGAAPQLSAATAPPSADAAQPVATGQTTEVAQPPCPQVHVAVGTSAAATSTAAQIPTPTAASPGPRLHPLQRAAQRPPAPTYVSRVPPPAAPATDADPLQVTEGQATFKPVWRRLYEGNFLPREAVSLAWRVMHGQLYCGAFWGRIRPNLGLQAACCKAPMCVAQLETLTHMFMGCPVVSPACDWLLDVWHAVSGVRPPRDARVLVADDDRVWHPEASLGPVWLALRVLYLHAVWRCNVLRRVAHKPFTATAVVAMVVRDVRRVLKYVWARTVNGTVSVFGIVQFTAAARAQRLSQFAEAWCHGGVLAVVQGGHDVGRELCVRFSSSWPVIAPV